MITKDNLRTHIQSHTKQNSWWLNDAKGIPLCRVCEKCIKVASSRYSPQVLGESGRYEDMVEEQIEDDY